MSDEKISATGPPAHRDFQVLGTGLGRIFASGEEDETFAELLALLDRVAPRPPENC
jgi:hypothetical protein